MHSEGSGTILIVTTTLIVNPQMVTGLDAVVNVAMHSEGRYAFVELRTPEMASAALQLSGQVLSAGSRLITFGVIRLGFMCTCL